MGDPARADVGEVVGSASAAMPVDSGEPGRYEARALAVLQAKGARETMAGEIALGIARSMDNASLTPPQAISAGKDLLKIMDQAIAEAPAERDGVDEAQERALRIAAEA